MSYEGQIYMKRDQRKQEILNVVLEHTKRYHPAHTGITSTSIARAMNMEPSSHIISMCKELFRDGYLDGYMALHRQETDNRDAVEKIYWYLPDYPPVKQERMDGF